MLRVRTRRRAFPTTVEVVSTTAYGVLPAEPQVSASLPATVVTDHALRVDILVRTLRCVTADVPQLVVIRSGPAAPVDGDLGWLAAWTVACGIAYRPAGTTWALGRYGFGDVTTGTWTRTEPRRHRR